MSLCRSKRSFFSHSRHCEQSSRTCGHRTGGRPQRVESWKESDTDRFTLKVSGSVVQCLAPFFISLHLVRCPGSKSAKCTFQSTCVVELEQAVRTFWSAPSLVQFTKISHRSQRTLQSLKVTDICQTQQSTHKQPTLSVTCPLPLDVINVWCSTGKTTWNFCQTSNLRNMCVLQMHCALNS